MRGYRRLVGVLLTGGVVAIAAALTPVAAAASARPDASSAAGAPFSCTEQSGGTVTGFPTPVRSVRVHTNHRFDRFVIALRGPLQQFDVRPQSSSTFSWTPAVSRSPCRERPGCSSWSTA